MKLGDDLGQAWSDVAKLGQPSLLDKQGDISAEPLERTSGSVVCVHLEGRLAGEAEKPRHLVKMSGDGEPIKSRGHGIASPEAYWPLSSGPPSGGVGPFEEPGGWAPGTRCRNEQAACRGAAAPDVAAHRHVRRLFGEATATDAQVSGNNYPVKRCEKASKRRGEGPDLS